MTDDTSWLQINCQTSEQFSTEVEKLMESAGALSITMRDAEDTPVLEPLPGETPLWDKIIITALFDADKNLTNLEQQLISNQSNFDISNISLEKLENQDWVRVWMKDFHPMKFGDKLWIYPSNYQIPDDDSVKIHLDPGLAFGTGTHPTTALCLEWLDQNHPKSLNVVDYGCGSGILAVAAAKLGAKHIIATDIDPQGLTATIENMARNNIKTETISCYLPEDCPQKPVDLVIANILCGPLIELFPTLVALTKPEGKLVLSGLLENQKDQLIDVYSSSFKQFDVKSHDNWVRISATKI